MTPLYTPKIAVITGATSGFGRETALRLAKLGSKLVVTGRRTERLEALREEVDVPVHIITQDITDTDKVAEDFANLPEEFRAVDLLLNNAGLALGTEGLQDKPAEDSFRMVDTNIKGLLAATHALLPGMVERQKGHIINVGSIAGNFAYPGGNSYCGTKAFVNHFSSSLRGDLKGKNVRVSCIEPGAVETEFSNVRFKGDNAKADSVYEGFRKMVGGEIADMIVWLATQPEHINVTHMEVMPTDQSPTGLNCVGVD